MPYVPENALSTGVQIQHYAIVDLLGAGSFGITYLAVDQETGQRVAIKEYLPREISGRYGGSTVALLKPEHQRFYQWGMDRFVTEAQILAQFNHPNIVRVLDYFHANGTAYFVMEYQRGQSLDEQIKRRATLSGQQTILAWLMPVLQGLAQIHAKNYLHRDIKPANIFLTDAGVPVLLDFGAACFAMGDEVRKTSDILTPAYAALEQYGVEQTLGPWTDIYALGATIYRALAGKAPVAASKRANAIMAGAADPLLPAAQIGADRCDPVFLTCVDWMLRLRTSDRPQNVAELLVRLGELDNVTLPSVTVSTGSARRAGNDSPVALPPPEQEYKIVFVGPARAGKSTAVATLSQSSVLTTARPSLDRRHGRWDATVALDYGYADVGADIRLHFYGTPGKPQFQPVVQALLPGARLLVLLLDARAQDPRKVLSDGLTQYKVALDARRLVIGLTHLDEVPATTMGAWQHALLDDQNIAVVPPLMSIDPRRTRDLQTLLQAALHAQDPGLVSAGPGRG